MTTLSLLNPRFSSNLSAALHGNGARNIDALLDDFFRPSPSVAFWQSAKPESTRPILIDVSETDTAYQVSAELPGFKKTEISVKIDGTDVSIEAVRATQATEATTPAPGTSASPATPATPAILRAERSINFTSKLARSFRLEHEIDDSKAEASFADGVLSLVLPKKAQPGAKSLPIQ